MFTDTSPPGLPAPVSGSPPTSGSQGEDWEARPRNAAPHEGPRLRSDPVLSHPAAWEGGVAGGGDHACFAAPAPPFRPGGDELASL